ncbi:MAG: hypothetical protein KAT68_00620 [Bacteroidales bacterium]|nr:hypothetical protein [Bacteroidales bacterium]
MDGIQTAIDGTYTVFYKEIWDKKFKKQVIISDPKQASFITNELNKQEIVSLLTGFLNYYDKIFLMYGDVRDKKKNIVLLFKKLDNIKKSDINIFFKQVIEVLPEFFDIITTEKSKSYITQFNKINKIKDVCQTFENVA